MLLVTNEDNESAHSAPDAETFELLEVGDKKSANTLEPERNQANDAEKIQNSRYTTSTLLLTVICSVPMINYGLTCFNPAIPVLQAAANASYYARYNVYLSKGTWQTLEALTMSIIIAGALLGSLSVKIMLSWLSRKQLMVLVHIVNISGALIISLGSGVGGSYEALIIGRFVMGFANGTALGIVPVIIGETCVKHRCAFYDGLIGVCLAVGALVGVIMGWSEVFGTAELWPLIVVTAAVPSIVYLGVSPMIVNTPFYVARNSTRDDVKTILLKLREGPESAIGEEVDEIMGVATKHELLPENEESDTASVQKDATFVEIVKNAQYRRQFTMVLLLFANLMLNGLNNILFFSDKIFKKAGIDADAVTVVTICVFLFQVLSTLPGSYILHRFGSWKLCIIGNIIMIIGHVLLVASLATQKTNPSMSYVAIVGVAVYLLGFAGGENIATFPLASELTTAVTRPVCINMGIATLWLSGWLVGFMAGYFEMWIGAYSFLIWMSFTVIFTIYIFFCVPNTGALTPDEVQRYFKR